MLPHSINIHANILPQPTISRTKLSPKYTLPPSNFSYLLNQFLLGVMWKDAPESINHAMSPAWVAKVVTKEFPSSFSNSESESCFFFFLFSSLQSFQKCPSLPQFKQITLDLPWDFDLPLFLDLEQPCYFLLLPLSLVFLEHSKTFWHSERPSFLSH